MVDLVEGKQDFIDHTEVSFPLWVKTLSWIVGLCFPVALLAMTWMANSLVEMKVEVASINGKLDTAVDDRYRQSQANDAHELITQRIERIEIDIQELQRLHGRD